MTGFSLSPPAGLTLMHTLKSAGCILSWSPDGKWLATTSDDRTMQVWDQSADMVMKPLEGYKVPNFFSTEWSPNGQWLALGHGEGTVRLWDLATGRLLHTLRHTLKEYWGALLPVQWSPDSKWLVTRPRDARNRACMWNPTTGKLLYTLKGLEQVHWSPDSKWLAAVAYRDNDRAVQVWDPATGALMHTLKGNHNISWSPDGQWLASVDGRDVVQVWDPATGALSHTFKGQKAHKAGSIYYVDWSPDGKWVAIVSFRDGSQVWELTSGRLLHAFDAKLVIWSPDGKWVATISHDEEVAQVWEPTTGKLLHTLADHVGHVHVESCSFNGKWLAFTLSDALHIWHIETGESLAFPANQYFAAWHPCLPLLMTYVLKADVPIPKAEELFIWHLDQARFLSKAPSSPAGDVQRNRESATTILQRKIAQQNFDVFLCYNRQDKAEVKQIGEQLKSYGILPWLDEWELRPGLPWQQLLEEQIKKIKSAAVFVGKNGIGPWQHRELYAFLREFAMRGCPVIPVLLPDAALEPVLPVFLSELTWVDFRVQDPEPIERLLWGIMGKQE